MTLSPRDQRLVGEFKAWVETLPIEAHAEALRAVSWAERHFWTWTFATALTGLVLGHYL